MKHRIGYLLILVGIIMISFGIYSFFAKDKNKNIKTKENVKNVNNKLFIIKDNILSNENVETKENMKNEEKKYEKFINEILEE